MSNLAWLRKPTLSKDLKLHELVILCQTILQPSRKTWEKFIQHLSNLERNKTLTSDEAVAIVVSEMTEDMLGAFNEDIDLSTLDDIVEKVLSTYQANARYEIQKYKSDADIKISTTEFESSQRIAKAVSREQNAIDEVEELKSRMQGQANFWVKIFSKVLKSILGVIALIGAVALIISHTFHYDLIGVLIGLAIIAFVILEFVGVLSHISHLQEKFEAILLPYARRFFGVDNNPEYNSSLLGLNLTDTKDKNKKPNNQET